MPAKRFPIRLPALEPLEVPTISKTMYPPPYDKIVAGRMKRRLGPVLGLTDFGVNITTLMPGAASAMRHYHSANDEFVYILEGEATLVTDAGEQLLVPGMCAGFPKGKKDGHHLVNKTTRPVIFMEMGTNFEPEVVGYPDQRLYLYDTKPGKREFTKTPPPKTGKAKTAKPKKKTKKKR